ncbi:SPFH domain-containing protein [Prosthecobacter sp.]|uniref:SPFH domain-containing protein n=1 Tax=Prosthecobacter sp. TaxID=1965333 RepID=UPI0037833B83
MDALTHFILTAAITFIGCSIAVPLILWFGRILGLYAVVQERRSQVYILFGKVIGTIDEPGLHFLPAKLGLSAFLVNWLGKCQTVDLRLDQTYLRSQAVNSEEGAPMGIGIWYEMFVSDPVAFLFKNTDPRGSLSANVSNSTVRCLSNLPLAKMLIDRHIMSDTVRSEVTPKSHEWGFKLGSVYIRKVHFRDAMMIKQIESKVVNRLRQVTSAIKQDGVNQVSVITSTAEKTAAVELAKAAAVRPEIVGNALRDISNDPDVAQAVFDVLEAQKIVNGKATVTLMPSSGGGLLADLLAAQQPRGGATPPPVKG